MLWSDEVLDKNSREMKRLWLTGTIAAGMAANPTYKLSGKLLVACVETADLILDELLKEKAK